MKVMYTVFFIYLLTPQIEIPKVKNMVNRETLINTLERGVMILIHDRKKTNDLLFISSGALINAPVQKVWNVITDYEHYPEFMPQTKRVAVEKENDNVWNVEYNLYFKFTIIKITVHYVVETYLDPPYDIWWTTKEGADNDIKLAMGRWELFPLSENKTAAFYTIYSDLKSMGRLIKFFLKHQPQIELAIPVSTGALVVNAIKERAEKGVISEKKEEKNKKDFSF